MIEIKDEQTSVILGHTRYADTTKSYSQYEHHKREEERSIRVPRSDLPRSQPGSIVTFHDYDIVVCDIRQTSVKCSLLIGETE
jgi:hypothetical protein